MAPSMPTSQHSFSVAMDIDPSPELEVFFVSSDGVEKRNPWDCMEDIFGVTDAMKDFSLTVEEAADQFTKAQLHMTLSAPAGGSYTISTAGASFGIADITDA